MLYPEYEFVVIADYTFNLTLIFALFCTNFFLYRTTASIPLVCMLLFCLFCTYFFFCFTDPGWIFLFAFFFAVLQNFLPLLQWRHYCFHLALQLLVLQLVKSIDNVSYSIFFRKMNYNIWIGFIIAGKAINKRTCKHQVSKTFYRILQQEKRLPN